MSRTHVLEERLGFLKIGGDESFALREARRILEPVIDEALDRFYAHILGEPALRSLFADAESIGRARAAQKTHWLSSLFSADYDNSYFERAERIGRAHARIGLTPSQYIGGYCFMLSEFIAQISHKCAGEPGKATPIIDAVTKAVFLDMDVVIHCYLEAKEGAMRDILQRATKFTTDVTELDNELAATAGRIKSCAADLSAESPRASPGAAMVERISTLVSESDRLSAQVSQLGQRLKTLQYEDRLYFDDAVVERGTFSRLKALLLGKR